MDKQIFKEFPNGQIVYDFNPTDEFKYVESVNEGMHVVQKEKGLTLDSAKKKALRRPDSLSEKCGYQTFVPCVACSNCVIIREIEHGEFKNSAYACKQLKRMVERYGTCTCAFSGKNGPFVIERDKTKADIEAHKNELIN